MCFTKPFPIRSPAHTDSSCCADSSFSFRNVLHTQKPTTLFPFLVLLLRRCRLSFIPKQCKFYYVMIFYYSV